MADTSNTKRYRNGPLWSFGMRLWVALSFSLFVLSVCGGCSCKKKEPIVLDFYCDETFWDVMWDEIRVFQGIYGIRVKMIPILPKLIEVPEEPQEDAASDTQMAEAIPTPVRRAPAPWRSRPQVKPVFSMEHLVLDQKISGLIAAFATGQYGDLYMSDSPEQLEELQSYALTTYEYPFCYLTMVLLVHKGNPHGLKSVEDVLRGNYRLGIANPSRSGMGSTAWNILSKCSLTNSRELFQELVTTYDYQSDLLEAFRQGEVDAALVWDALVPKTTDFALALRLDRPGQSYEPGYSVVEPITVGPTTATDTVPGKEHRVWRVPLVSLRVSSRENYGRRFADFLISSRGRAILKKHGFIPVPP